MSFTAIPLIDFAPMLGEDHPAHAQTAAAIRAAFGGIAIDRDPEIHDIVVGRAAI
jgi:isopenicillin N synthase-like dioxygenase